jgi:outer membrane lipoprotein SlyB
MKKICLVILGLMMLTGCTTMQRGAGVGAVGGGALGAIIGHQSGHTGQGAAIGAAAGAITGAVVAEKMETKFCTLCGKRFTGSLEYCPYDGTVLKVINK